MSIWGLVQAAAGQRPGDVHRGVVTSARLGACTVRLASGALVTVPLPAGAGYAVGDHVLVALPGGQAGQAHLLGPAPDRSGDLDHRVL